jgi:hypothetical protein
MEEQFDQKHEPYINVPLTVYQAVLLELQESRKVLDSHKQSEDSLPKRQVAIGREPVTFRYEAWFK